MRKLIRANAVGPAVAATLTGSYVVDGDRVIHPDGHRSAVITTANLDVDALDSGRRRAIVSAFARLCQTLDGPTQVVVRVRRATPEDPPADAAGQTAQATSRLAPAMHRFWSARLVETPVHTRTVLLATRSDTSTALTSGVARLLSALHAMGIEAHRLGETELVAAIAGGFPLAAQLAWVEHPQYARIATTLVRGFALRRLPGHAVGAGWLAPLLRIAAECDIAVHLAPASLSETLNKLGRRLRDFSAHRLIEAERGAVGDINVDIGLDSAHSLRGRLARSLGRPMHMSLTITVRGSTLEDLRHSSDCVRQAFGSALVGFEPAHFRHVAAFVSTLPLAVDSLAAVKLVESGAAATCVPWAHTHCSDAGGYRLGAAVQSGIPVDLAPFDTTHHPNANIAIFAASGHGKSFAVGALVLEAAARGVDAIVIDPEGEYRGLVSALGGTYLALAPGTDAAVNIFDDAGNGADAATSGEEAIAGVVDLVSVLCGGRLTDVERALVDAAAREALASAAHAGRSPVLADCLPGLEREARQVAVVVRRFCTGALGMLFNRETSVRAHRGVCAISLRDMPAEHVAAATLIVGRWLWQLVLRDRRRRHVIFDEVGSLCVHPALRALLVQLARRCRKYGASLVVATQNAQDLLGSDEGSVVATNCAMVLLGGHRAAEAARIERAFGLTEAQRRFLESAARGEFLLLAGDRRIEMRVEVPPLHHSILTANPLDAQHGSPQDMGAPWRADPNMWDN